MIRYLITILGIVTGGLLNAQPLSCNPTAAPSELCQGQNSLLFANASGGSGNYTFSWTSSPPGFISDLPNPVVFPIQTTTYYLTVHDGSETCQGDITVIVNPRPIPNAGPDQNVPFGTWTTLQGSASGGSGSYIYHWEPASQLVDPNAQNPQTVSLMASTLFNLNVTDLVTGCECSYSDDVMITILGGPLSVLVMADPAAICIYGSVQLSAFASGGAGNYSYSWTSDPPGFISTLQNPIASPEITQTFFVAVSDVYNTVMASVTVIVSDCEINLEPVAEPDHICLGSSTQLFANATGGNGSLFFYWTSDPPGFISTAPNPFVSPTISTLYYLEVTDMDNTVNDSVTVTVHPGPDIYSLSNGGFICPDGTGIELMLNGSELNITYELFRNSITTGITISGTGGPISFGYLNQVGEYNALGFNAGCHVQMNNVAIISYPNFKDEICIISVDSMTGKNFIIWNKTADNAISAYNIYRESTTGGTYTIIGNVAHDNPGIFSDNSSNPLQRSFSYSITTIDTCGTESAMGSIHKTMHLNINAGINSYNLIWTPYEGIEYQTYYIYRRQLPDGFQVIDSVPNSIQSYSDLNPPQGVLDYVIEIRNETGCNPGKGQNQYSSVFSNIISTNVGVNDLGQISDLYFIHPNPAREFLSIASVSKTESLIEVAIYDLQGRVIVHDSFIAETSLLIDSLIPGMYILVISQDNQYHYQRIVKL
jgi:hypothetical protein